jgi:hypothetical protein
MIDLKTATWRKSSYSSDNGGNCVEVADSIAIPAATWRTSSYSSSNGGNCVEVSDGISNVVPVRDSKDPQGPALVFTAAAWSAFIADLKTGHLPA